MKNKIIQNKSLKNEFVNNKKKFFINFIPMLLILIIGMIFIGGYHKINEAGLNEDKDRIEGYIFTNEFEDDFSKITFVLYKEALESIQGKEIEASDIYVKPESEFESSNDYNVLKNKVNDYLKDWKNDFENDFLNLDYVVLDKDENVIKSNNNSLNELAKSNDINDLKDKYSFCVSIKFDENGQFHVNNIYGAEESLIGNEFLLRSLVYTDNYDIVNPMKNMTFMYGINKELKYHDKIHMKVNKEGNRYENITYTYIFILSAIIIILSLVTPFKLENDINVCKKILKMPFEIVFAVIFILVVLMTSAAPDLIRETVAGDYTNGLLYEIFKISPTIGNPAVYLFNLLYWSVYIISILISVMIIKNIFSFGVIKYCKEKTLIGIIIRFIKRNVQKIYIKLDNIIKNVDLRDKSNKVIIIICGVNYLILLILCSLHLFDKFFITIYSIILFLLIKNYYNDIKNKFIILLMATNKIADGDLEAKIDEDVGLFNHFKELIERIQMGFKKAVDEELKSQKMKTDLISNVSHDLKTPLTSIITYVDLLKNENITEEERKSYIDTLDKKSQRLKFLIEDLFEVSKATSGNITLNLVKVDIVELMKQTQFELEDKINDADLKIKNNFPKNKVILELDSQKTFRIFENLLINVSKYAMKGTRVYINIVEAEDSVEIDIKNISAEEINFDPFDIVERFQRGDKSRNTEGSGLGLAIAKSFVEAQGGTFNVEVDGDLFKVIVLFKK